MTPNRERMRRHRARRYALGWKIRRGRWIRPDQLRKEANMTETEPTERTVTTPGGDTIEVVSDADWVAMLGTRDARVLKGSPGRDAVLRALWEHGPYEDPKGFVTPMIHRDAVTHGYDGSQVALNQLWKGPLGPAIERDTRGKRTYRVALTALPRTWADQLQANGAKPVEPEPEAEPVTLTAVPEPVLDADDYTGEAIYDDGAVRLDVAQSVATALLAQVIDIVSTGKPDTAQIEALDAEAQSLRRELDDASRRLATALEYGQRSAREARRTGDELVAVKHERDGLRQRLRQAEANLSKTMSPANQRTLDELVHKEVDRVMRAAPIHRSPDDG